MHANNSNQRKIHTMMIACALCAAVLVAYSKPASAEDAGAAAQVIRARVESLPVRDLEKAFWVCDHTAAVHGVHAAPVELCSAVYDALREHKFGGDFSALLGWWQQNKHIEHSALAIGR
jgi:hypothetical protein